MSMNISTTFRRILQKMTFLLVGISFCSVSAFAADNMTGTVKFKEDFGHATDSTNVYSSFVDAGLSSLGKIGASYIGYTKCGTTQMGPNNYVITPTCANLDKSNCGAYFVHNLCDHTGNTNGNMLVVDGSKTAGMLFGRMITGLCQDADFEARLWYAYAHESTYSKSEYMPNFQFEIWTGEPYASFTNTEAEAFTVGEKYKDAAGTGTVTLLAKKNNLVSYIDVTSLHTEAAKAIATSTPAKPVCLNNSTTPVYQYISTDGNSYFCYQSGTHYYTPTLEYGVFYANSNAMITDADSTALEMETATKTQNFTYKGFDASKLWQSLDFTFTLPDQDYCYFVIRNFNDGTTGNDFAIDDISFQSYTPFDMNVKLSTAASTTSCADGIITLTSILSGPSNTTSLAKEIMNYGFYFQGGKINASGDTIWTKLGSDIPLQIMSLQDKLEVNITVNQYNYYDCFRLAVASEPANLNTDCVTFSSSPLPRGEKVVSPDYDITGDDICIESADLTKTGTATYTIKAIATDSNCTGSGCTGWWSAKVRLSNGTIKTITPSPKTCQ